MNNIIIIKVDNLNDATLTSYEDRGAFWHETVSLLQ